MTPLSRAIGAREEAQTAPLFRPLRSAVRGHLDWIVFACALAMLAFATWQAQQLSRRADQDERWLRHTFDVLTQVHALDRAALEMESEHRAWRLGGAATSIAARSAAKRRGDEALQRIGELVVDNPAQAGRAAEAARRLAARHALMEAEAPSTESSATPASERGSADDAALQASIRSLAGEEEGLLDRRGALASSTAAQLRWSLLYGPALALILLVAAFATLRRQLRLTERTRVALADKSALQNAMLDAGGYMIIAVALDGQVALFNRAAAQRLGYRGDDVIGVATPALFHDAAEIDQRARELSAELGVEVKPGMDVFTARPSRGLPEQRVWTYVARDGERFPVQLAVAMVTTPEGAPRGFIGMAQDITERVAREREIRSLNQRLQAKANQLEESVASLESFSYTISHDLRAPVRHIDGYAQMLIEDASAVLDPECRRYLDAIGASSRRMGVLIDDLLALSRLDRRPMDIESVDMRRLVEESIAEVRGGGVLPACVEVGMLPDAPGDPSVLRQVWINLISNALKYSAPRGAGAVVAVSGARDGAFVRYEVSDNGIGFDMRYADKLFGVFQRLHADEAFEGTGIGLAIVRRIVVRHGGSVAARATPGHGATFSFRLPLQPEPA